ncbi:Putative serine protease K12H4.7 [Eumeta japonica]|uniref:Serine protease K12H4.7 n=1 Tax=Eumeta variegata TaxID=151549 RepID=A0A4C1WQ49_EUMVA|nr:Putative serine protease K12H4.7 [Eumeta japonica]
MMKLLVLLCVIPYVLTLNVTVVEPPLRVELLPPKEALQRDARNVQTLWITMPIDHFDPHNRDTFQMRYMVNEQFFGGDDSPIFIFVGGEWAISTGWLLAGNMYTMAEENNGYMVYTEHRYYGQTLPYAQFTIENLRFLNVDQALADLAYFIHEMKKSPRFANSKVIMYGGSYAANMVLWFKQRYSHLVEGVIASSGPILAEVDFHGYLETVHNAFLSEGGEQCINTIGQGIADAVAALDTEAGRIMLRDLFRLCELPNVDDRFDLGYFSGIISWAFSGSVQSATPGSLFNLCQLFLGTQFGSTPIEKIAGYLAWNYGTGGCFGNFQTLLNAYSGNCVVPYSTRNPYGFAMFVRLSVRVLAQRKLYFGMARAWYYQTCTEYGYFQIAPTSGTAFDSLRWLTVEFYAEVCKRAFDERFDEQFIYDAAERVNTVFGGLYPDVNNTINIHGMLDPWRAIGVFDRDLKDNSPTIDVPRQVSILLQPIHREEMNI